MGLQNIFYPKLPNIPEKSWRVTKTKSKAIVKRYALQANANNLQSEKLGTNLRAKKTVLVIILEN